VIEKLAMKDKNTRVLSVDSLERPSYMIGPDGRRSVFRRGVDPPSYNVYL